MAVGLSDSKLSTALRGEILLEKHRLQNGPSARNEAQDKRNPVNFTFPVSRMICLESRSRPSAGRFLNMNR